MTTTRSAWLTAPDTFRGMPVRAAIALPHDPTLHSQRHIVVIEQRPGVFGTLEIGLAGDEFVSRDNRNQWVGSWGHYDRTLACALADMMRRALPAAQCRWLAADLLND